MKQTQIYSWRGGNQMILCGELQSSTCLDSQRSCPVLSKQRLISDTWDCEVKELWPLQVTRNTGEICVCPNWCVRVGAGILTLTHVFDSTEDLTHMNTAGKCLSRKREPEQQPAPSQSSPSMNTVRLSEAYIPTSLTNHHTHTHTPTHTHIHIPAEPQEIPAGLWKRGSRGRRAV